MKNLFNKDIVVGEKGHLFLIKSVHNILEHMTRNIKIDEASKVNFFKNITSRKNYCEIRNISYMHVIYPDKLSVLNELFPIKNLSSFTSFYRPFFTQDILNLQSCLKDGNENNYFFKTDTHLTFEGKVKTSITILEQFFDLDKKFLEETFTKFKGKESLMLGDLGSKLESRAKEVRFEIVAPHLKRFSNQVGGNDGLAIICINKEKITNKEVKRLLVFGDSFFERTLPFISYMYSEVLFCRSRYFHEEIVEMYKPDHVITESAERYFSNVRLDDMCSRFNLVYGLKGNRYSDNKEFYVAYNAVLNYNRPPWFNFINSFNT